MITYYLSQPSNRVEISILDAAGRTIRTLRGPANAGLNRATWDLRMEGNGPKVLPGKYIASVEGIGKSEATVLPDPKFLISDADRKTRQTAIMNGYTLQQHLISVRDAARRLAGPEGMRLQSEINRIIAAAANVQNAMDNYSGLPTAAQLRQLDWAWEDAVAAVNEVNGLLPAKDRVRVPKR